MAKFPLYALSGYNKVLGIFWKLFVAGKAMGIIMRFYIKTGSITNAQRSKNLLLKYNINASIKRLTDIQKGDGCGWTVIVSERDVRQAVAVLEQNSIKVLGVERLDIS